MKIEHTGAAKIASYIAVTLSRLTVPACISPRIKFSENIVFMVEKQPLSDIISFNLVTSSMASPVLSACVMQ